MLALDMAWQSPRGAESGGSVSLGSREPRGRSRILEYGFYSTGNPAVPHARWCTGLGPPASATVRDYTHPDVQRLWRPGPFYVCRDGLEEVLLATRSVSGAAIQVVCFRTMSRMTFIPARHRYPRPSLLPVLLMMMACGENNRTPAGPSPADGIRDSAALFQLITQTDPLTEYTLFPNVEEFAVGRLNGSEAHRPIVRVSMNARALGALQSGRLPTAEQFPDGSIILKEVRARADAPATLYAVMYKDAGNTLAGDGWLWAEFSPDGSVGYSVSNRGTACASCHQREQGPQNDLVRTFERQR